MRNVFLFLTVITTCLSCKSQGGEVYSGPNPHHTALDTFINRKADSLFRKAKLPGMFIGVLNNGARSYYNFGYANPEKQLVFDSTTVFEAGSITKTFTAYVAASVLKEKNISDTGFIISWLPDSVKQNKALEKITFINLLNHTAGFDKIPDDLPVDMAGLQPYEHYDVSKLLGYLKRVTPKPDGNSNYSNTGYAVLGMLAEFISGKSYSQLLNEYIFKPLQIKAGITVPPHDKISQGYFEKRKAPYWIMASMAPTGAIKCTAAEMLTYLQHMSASGAVLSDEIIDDLLKPTKKINEAIKIGKGWHTMQGQSGPIIYWHNGGTYGFSTFAGFLKDSRKAVVIVINQMGRNNISDMLGFMILRQLSK